MTGARPIVGEYTVKPLDADSWDAFAALVERHTGIDRRRRPAAA